jgi:hypothetical protein
MFASPLPQINLPVSIVIMNYFVLRQISEVNLLPSTYVSTSRSQDELPNMEGSSSDFYIEHKFNLGSDNLHRSNKH